MEKFYSSFEVVVIMEDDYEKEIRRAVHGILHWNYRNLTAIPEELNVNGKLISDIYLKGNLILKIPSWITKLESLTELHLSENRLTYLPEEICQLESLQIFDISQNRIEKIPESFTTLKSLTMFCANENKISSLPISIGNMKALTHLFVSRNFLKYVPESIVDNVSLQEIVLDYNCLCTLPSSMFNLPNLKVLSIYCNTFLYLPSIRPISEPRLIMGTTNLLKCVSLDTFVYIIHEEIHPEGPFGRNLKISNMKNDEEDEIVRGYSKIIVQRRGGEASSQMTLELPFSKLHDVGVPTLYESCLRYLYGEFQQQNKNYHSIKNSINKLKLPKTIQNDLRTGPRAYCQNITCRRALFQNAIIRIFDSDVFHDLAEFDESYHYFVHKLTKVIVYFCSAYCSELFDLGRCARSVRFSQGFRELDWMHYRQ